MAEIDIWETRWAAEMRYVGDGRYVGLDIDETIGYPRCHM